MAASLCIILPSTATSEELTLNLYVPVGPIPEGETHNYEVIISEGAITGSQFRYEFDWSKNPEESFDVEDVIETTDTSCTIEHIYYDDGTYIIGVRVYSGEDENFVSNTVTVTDLIPTVFLTISEDPPYDTGTECTFDASGSSSVSDEIIEYVWDWGFSDSGGPGGFEIMESTYQNSIAFHTYTEPGEYRAAVKVIDDDGSYDIAFIDLVVEGTSSGPIITNTYPPNGSIIEITPTIHATYYSDGSEIDADNVVLTIDGTNINTIATTTDVMYTPTYDMAYGNHKVTVEVPDVQGNYVIKEWFFTIVEPGDIHEESMGDIPAGVEVTVIPEDTQDTCIDSLDIKPSTYLENTEVTMVKLEEPPTEIPEPTSENDVTYQYLDIKFTSNQVNVPDDYIESAFIKFKVRKSWINDNDISEESIRLMRYHDSQWEELPTVVLEDGDINICFESETPGFSTFAVVGSEIVLISPPYETEVPEVPWLFIIGITAIITIILMLVLFKARYIYFKEEQQVKNSKKEE